MKKYIHPEHLLLLFILVVAAAFRFYKLRTAPDWYMDEGEFIRLANDLSRGNFNFLGIRDSMLLIGRPPLYLWLIAGLFKLFWTDIIILRAFSVICSLVTIVVTYSLARQALGRKVAFYASLILAVLPEYIFYNRIGFSYNWTGLWILVFCLAFWNYFKSDRQKWLLFACLAAGIAFASDYIGMICILVLVAVLLFTHPIQLWKVPIAGIPWLVSMLPVFIASPLVAFHDLRSMLFLGSPADESLIFILWRMMAVYSTTFQQQTLIVLGVIGVFVLPDKRLRKLILLLVGGIFLLFLANRVLVWHYLLNVWPFLMVGMGYLLERTLEYFFTSVKSALVNFDIIRRWVVNDALRSLIGSLASTVMVFVLVLLPVTWMVILDIRGFLMQPLEPGLALAELHMAEGYMPAVDAESIVAEIFRNSDPDDLIIAPGQVYWMLPDNSVDIRTVAVYEYGGKMLGLPYFDPNRFVANVSLSGARYAVVDNTWRYWWADQYPVITSLLDEVNTWPMMLTRGDVQLFCNPSYCR